MTGPRDAPALPLPPLRDMQLGPPSPAHGEPPTVVEPPELDDANPLGITGTRERFGRYVVLGEIGAGTMGVVLSAYDRELDRKIAIKLLRTDLHDSPDGALRMRREAQAMARLSHPNVAQVYEAGEIRGQLFLAMEFIDGVTLRAWMTQSPHPWREVLRVYLQAGHGLAAAHAAGLAHRDFKPDNAMLGADGRVRVLDFGLSRGRGGGSRPRIDITRQNLADIGVTAAGSLLGTPAYMAPEQFHGEDADARSDQFGFCVALWEALYGMRPYAGRDVAELRINVLAGTLTPQPANSRVPAWVRKIVRRGLSCVPSDRWPSMGALLAALEHDPSRTHRRWLAAGLGGVLLIGAGYTALAYRDAQAQICGNVADELADVWSSDDRAALERAIRATAVPYAGAVWSASAARLDTYRELWVARRTATCEADRLGHISSALFDRRMACLRQRRAELAAAVDVMRQTTTGTVAQVVEVAAGLPPIATCDDDLRLMADAASPIATASLPALEQARSRLARLQALDRSGRYPEARAAVLDLLQDAERLGHSPHLAEVHLLAGKLAMQTLQYDEALPHLERAELLGLAARSDAVAAEALTTWLFIASYGLGRTADALAAAPRAEALIQRLGSPPVLSALLHNNVALLHEQMEDRARSLAEYEAGYALLVEHAPDDPLRAALANNLALAQLYDGQQGRARATAEAELARTTAAYGACHPMAAILLLALAHIERSYGRFDAAMARGDVALACFADTLPGHALVALSFLYRTSLDAGERARASGYLARTRSLAPRTPDPQAAEGLLEFMQAAAAVQDGRWSDARPLLLDLEARYAAYMDPGDLAVAALWLALAALADNDALAALAHLERTARLPKKIPELRALLQFTRARALHAAGREPAEVLALADQAIDAYERAGPAFAARSAEVRAWRSAR